MALLNAAACIATTSRQLEPTACKPSKADSRRESRVLELIWIRNTTKDMRPRLQDCPLDLHRAWLLIWVKHNRYAKSTHQRQQVGLRSLLPRVSATSSLACQLQSPIMHVCFTCQCDTPLPRSLCVQD